MDEDFVKELLNKVYDQSISPDSAFSRLRHLSSENLGFARIDHHRALRKGFPEVIFCQGKTPDQIRCIIQHMLPSTRLIMATRANQELYDYLKVHFPQLAYNPQAGILYFPRHHKHKPAHGIAVLCAGTSDVPVAEEAAFTAEYTGSAVHRYYDVGIAGLQRLLDCLEEIHAGSVRVIVAVAGMEGALPGVVTGLTSLPVIAVPTSIGYGTHFHGLASLLAMLNSCSSGMTVVNIDNGFGAGYFASQIIRSR